MDDSSPGDSPAPYAGGVRRPDGAYAVPQRYSIGMIMAVTTAFAGLLAALRAMFDLPPLVIGGILMFFMVVGIGQSLISGGRHPRIASMICGGLAMPLMMLMAFIVYWFRDTPAYPVAWFCTTTVCIPIGAGFGYLAGGLIASVFMLCDMAIRHRRRD